MSQLTLPFPLNQNFTFASFVGGPNAELVARLQQPIDEFAVLWVSGVPGTGRSHLLHAVCHLQASKGHKVAFVPCAGVHPDPEILEGLQVYDLVALDDVDDWCADPDLERALMGLYQGLTGRGGWLLCAAEHPASRIDFGLADLASRMRSAESFDVRELSDADKALVLASKAHHRGLQIPDNVLRYWLARGRRGMSSLLDDFERLDQAALVEQRRVTVPLVKKVLGI